MTHYDRNESRERFKNMRYYHTNLDDAEVREKVETYRQLLLHRDELQDEHDQEAEILDSLSQQRRDIATAMSIARLSQESKKELEAMSNLVEAELAQQREKIRGITLRWTAVMECIAPIVWHWRQNPNRFSDMLRFLKEEKEWPEDDGDMS